MCQGAQFIKTNPKEYAMMLRRLMHKNHWSAEQLAEKFAEEPYIVEHLNTTEKVQAYLDQYGD